MLCCLFYCSLAFQSDPKPFMRVIAFRVSSPKKEERFKNVKIYKVMYGIWNKKRHLRRVNSILLLIQTTCLRFKMASNVT